ncbi:MAG: hypothetical protein NW207_09160 [Cytophagales bacterium]|nr:hypothetical protein [Cytophagales bacterium]
MDKILISILLIVCLCSTNIFAQKYALIDEHGDIYDVNKKYIGALLKDGTVLDDKNFMVAHIDNHGYAIVKKNNFRICNTNVEGDLTATFQNKVFNWKTYYPTKGSELCEVKEKDTNGEIIVLVHKKYKQYGSSAYYSIMYLREGLLKIGNKKQKGKQK